jgi:DNA-binding winged helix-turn-helix (wHTH) protein
VDSIESRDVSSVRFGEFTLLPLARELRRHDRPIHLSPKAFQLLEALLARSPAALSKAELHEVLWPDTHVVEANLANLVGELRRAIGDRSRTGGFIRTVHGYGYAFRSPGPAPAPEGAGARCQLVWRTGRAPLSVGDHILGRDPDLELCFDARDVSRSHARIRVTEEGATLEDMGSKNGTYLNGRRLQGPAALQDADEIRLGPKLRLRFRAAGATHSTETHGAD